VSGIATNLAARLQAAALPGEIPISEETRRRVERWLSDRGASPEREELELKDFAEPQPTYRLSAPLSALELAADSS
jgi:class 3 adenylate cyclase